MVSSTEKSISTVADALCDVTRNRGVTEIRVVDHAMSPMVKAGIYQELSLFMVDHIKFDQGCIQL